LHNSPELVVEEETRNNELMGNTFLHREKVNPEGGIAQQMINLIFGTNTIHTRPATKLLITMNKN